MSVWVVSLLRQFAQVGGGCFCLLLRCFLAEGEEEEARFFVLKVIMIRNKTLPAVDNEF